MKKIPLIKSNSSLKTIWNIIVIFAVLIFSIIFSYRYTFHIYSHGPLYWGILLILAIDIVINFNSTVRVEHAESNDRKIIAGHYLKQWFTPDLFIALPLDFILLMALGIPEEHEGKQLYYFALMFITIIKLLKIKKITKELQQYLRVNPGIMRLMIFAFWFTQAVHYISLGWILIGASESARIPIDQYIRALYWSVTTVATIGYGDYLPDHDSNLQIIFTIIVQIFGVGMYGYIISNVSGLIANLDVARSEFIKKIESVRIYLNNKKIPGELQEKILGYYHYIWDKKKNISDANPISDLPDSLTLEIMLYLNRDMLKKVDLFKNAEDIFVREAIYLLKPSIYIPDDYIIRQDDYGDCMFFLSSGEVEVLVNNRQVAKLYPGSTFGETALLIGEKRSATIHTLTHCEVYKLSKTDFDNLRSRFPEFNREVEEISRQRGLLNKD